SNATARAHRSGGVPCLVAAVAACAGPPSSLPVASAGVRLVVDAVEVAFTEPRVLSIDDANERYQVTLTTALVADTGRGLAALLQGGGANLACSSAGRDGAATWLVFPATPAEARAIAAALGVPAQSRAPWPARCEALLSTVAEVTAGAASVPLRFELRNTGEVAVWFMDGGRGRNRLGRDNRFQFAVQCNGVPVAIERVEDFGGIGCYRRLGPGEAWTFTPDLAHWCRLDRAGRYVVRAAYEAELMPAEFEPAAALPLGVHAHLQRLRTVSAALTFDVR
ncbi:MAG: hypothetical protein WAT39_12790, partial [Planctomycetota bacterium]